MDFSIFFNTYTEKKMDKMDKIDKMELREKQPKPGCLLSQQPAFGPAVSIHVLSFLMAGAGEFHPALRDPAFATSHTALVVKNFFFVPLCTTAAAAHFFLRFPHPSTSKLQSTGIKCKTTRTV